MSSAEPPSPPSATASDSIPTAASSTHAVQRPLGASEKIFAPHLRQTLITLIIARDVASVAILYCVKFCPVLCANDSNQVTQFVFDIGRSRDGIGDFLTQQRLIALPKSIKSLRNGVLSHPKLRGDIGLRRRARFIC